MTEYEVWTAQRFTARYPAQAVKQMIEFMSTKALDAEYIVYWTGPDGQLNKLILDGGN